MQSSRSAADPLFAGTAGFAHRGLHGRGVCENSLAAFQAAIDADAGIECDLRLSRDGFAMVFHDSSLERLCGVNVEMESLHAAALMHFRLGGSDQRIPWLGELLSLVNGKVPLLLELKRQGGRGLAGPPIDHLCAAMLKALRAYRGPVGVMSFDPRASSWFARHAPQVRRGLVIADKLSPVRRWSSMLLADPQFLAVDRAALGRPWVARARRRMTVASWTIRSETERTAAIPLADALIWEADGRPRS
ncbi:MAG: glycerophosphodiester phosphodiesterase [Sphingomonas bacterium]|nr:glycerophosphodiester phosphodiesterase [Sphingomonas bacterium]